ncbi:uncharacterized protein LOC100878033 [Megachile rotundata]|uniref:uncharacterized protein LOC100878033 n=1 Tax=Megachile rotundata TaxID=143995 RepID=UPI000258E46D|nr:PREDICTED: uncharacterized protein LOC100878033 [Megachile rotundata]
MNTRVFSLWIVFLQLVLVLAMPVAEPQNDNLELLAARDTVRYPYVFWFRRPFYDQDYDGGDNTYYNLPPDRRSSTISYANVGAGWGR